MSEPSKSDIAPDGLLFQWLPKAAHPYAVLMRADRPIGTWLLLLPGWWALTLAAKAADATPPWALFGLFALGAFVMRGAGCVYNDIVDSDYDAQVARTATRPIPSGDVSKRQAWVFLVILSLIGFAVLISMNTLTILLGLASLGLVAAYPFMKRLTYWPQAWLGLTFNWGAVMGWTAVTGTWDWRLLLLYGAGIAWTLGYDTLYAHQDKEDDALIGVKSTALALGENTKPALWVFYGATVALLLWAGTAAGLGPLYGVFVTAAGAQAAWQIVTADIDDPANCLTRFKSNRDFGLIVLAGLVVG